MEREREWRDGMGEREWGRRNRGEGEEMGEIERKWGRGRGNGGEGEEMGERERKWGRGNGGEGEGMAGEGERMGGEQEGMGKREKERKWVEREGIEDGKGMEEMRGMGWGEKMERG